MVVLGLLLLLASGALTVGMVLQNTDAASASVFGQSVSGMTVGGLFLAGGVTGAIAILGLTMVLAGARRGRARRVTRKREMRDAVDQRETLAEENARLRSQLASARTDEAVYPDDEVVGRHSETDTADRRSLFDR